MAATKFYEPDPAQDGLDLSATFVGPGATEWHINGFYDGARWLVRFAPDEVGDWTFSVRAEDKSGVATWEGGSFGCVWSTLSGWPRISGRNLFTAGGESFLPIGHNTGWQYDPEQPSFEDMASNGENLLSYWLAVPWALPSYTTPEEPWWEQRAPIENIEDGIGNYNQAACAAIDGVVARADEWNILLLPTIWSHGQLRVPGQPWADGWWANNAYSAICSAADFFKTEELGSDTPQWHYQKNFYRYLVARWGYSRVIAGWVLICEINGTTSYAENAGQAVAWCATADAYIRQLDPFRRNDSGQYPMASTLVEQAGWDSGHDMRSTDSYNAKNSDTAVPALLASETSIFRASGLPGFHAEFGGDVFNGATQPRHLHNGLWAGTMSGAAITPLLWCDGGNYPMLTQEMSDQYRRLADFITGLDYLTGSTGAPAGVSLDDPACRGWGMADGYRACAWIQNTSGTLGGQIFTLCGLEDESYRVEWYDIWNDGLTPFATEETTSAGGTLNATVPALAQSDMACRIEPLGETAPPVYGGSILRAVSRQAVNAAASAPAVRQSDEAALAVAGAGAPGPVSMEFSREGVAGKVAAAVERVVGAGRAQAAITTRGNARLACVVVDSPQRQYELDAGLTPESFGALAKQGFSAAADDPSKIISILRSVAGQAMRYRRENGDRLVLVLCPRDEWPQLDLEWTE